MKTSFFIIGICLLITSCSTRNIQENTQDPIEPVTMMVEDTVALEEDAATEDDFLANDSITASFQQAVETTKSESEKNYRYSITGTFSGYESSADATYYFDGDLHLTHCEITWSSEGTSGEQAYYFKADEFIAGREKTYYPNYDETVFIYADFKPIFGVSKTDEPDVETIVKYLDKSEFDSRSSSIQNDFNRLINRISEYQDSVSVNSGSVTLRIENTVNYGVDVTEREDFQIDKILFDRLIKD
jgi:hypothetical protein